MNTKNNEVAVTYLRQAVVAGPEGFARQLDHCTAYAEAHGLTLDRTYSDTGSEMATTGLPGLSALLDAARDRLIDHLVVEDSDRISRDLTDLTSIFTRLESYGVAIHDARRGRLHLRDVTFQGIMADEGRDLFWKRIPIPSERPAPQGLTVDKCAYGYERAPNGRGERLINPAQADVVRKVFDLCLQGYSPRRIATALNQSPDADRSWTKGAVGRMLRKELYDGRVVHGKHTRLRDRRTRCIVVTPVPEDAWKVVAVEHLRIVAREIWLAVQAMLKAK